MTMGDCSAGFKLGEERENEKKGGGAANGLARSIAPAVSLDCRPLRMVLWLLDMKTFVRSCAFPLMPLATNGRTISRES